MGWLAGTVEIIREIQSGEIMEEIRNVVELGEEVKKEIGEIVFVEPPNEGRRRTTETILTI